MTDVKREYGVVGLGRMGGNLARQALEKGIRLVDLGTSGGVDGARHGACFMAGGDQEAIDRIEPILLELATDGAMSTPDLRERAILPSSSTMASSSVCSRPSGRALTSSNTIVINWISPTCSTAGGSAPSSAPG